MDSGRWQEVTVPIKNGTHFVTVANFYGIPTAGSNALGYAANERLIAAAIRRMHTFSDRPYFLGGDFNISSVESKALSNAEEMQEIYDIAEQWRKCGEDTQNTFSRDGISKGMEGPGKTRIDMVYANFIGKHIVSDFQYRFDLAEGYDHIPLQITISAEHFVQKIDKCANAETINFSKYEPKIHTHEMRQEMFVEKIWPKYQTEFDDAIQAEELEKAHRVWCKASEEFLKTLLNGDDEKSADTSSKGVHRYQCYSSR
jgi:hypothetical protein